MYHNLCNHSPTDIHSSCLQFSPLLENTMEYVLVVKIFTTSIIASLGNNMNLLKALDKSYSNSMQKSFINLFLMQNVTMFISLQFHQH